MENQSERNHECLFHLCKLLQSGHCFGIFHILLSENDTKKAAFKVHKNNLKTRFKPYSLKFNIYLLASRPMAAGICSSGSKWMDAWIYALTEA